MQPQHKLPPRAPSPQGFGGGPAFPPVQGIGNGASSTLSAEAEAAASARAAAQMAYEDAWKASNPDFRTPFASVEDAITRLLPYHVFAEYEEVDTAASGTEEMLSDWRWDKAVLATVVEKVEEFEKLVLSFNLRARGHGEERLLLERALLQDEQRATERLRAMLIVQHEQQQRQQQQEEATRASRLALAQAQAQVASAWPLMQPTASAWQHALAAVTRGEGIVHGQVDTAATQGAAMHPQLDPATASAWLLMHQHQQQQQQQQQHLGQLGVWPTYAAPLGGGNSMGQAGPSAVWQEQPGEQTMGGTAAAGMAQPWWASGAQRREQ